MRSDFIQQKAIVAMVVTSCRLMRLILIISFAASPAIAEEHGKFVGELKYKPIGKGIHKVLEYFEYVDPEGEVWGVPKGTETDGASIPRILWTIVGSPFTGDYTTAAVVHDHFCDMKSRGWQETHRTFYHAMRAAGETDGKAKLMFLGVYYRGPRWTTPVAVAAKKVCEMVHSMDGNKRIERTVCKVVYERVRSPPIPFPMKSITAETLKQAPATAEVEKLLSSGAHESELAPLALSDLEAKADTAWKELEALSISKKKN